MHIKKDDLRKTHKKMENPKETFVAFAGTCMSCPYSECVYVLNRSAKCDRIAAAKVAAKGKRRAGAV